MERMILQTFKLEVAQDIIETFVLETKQEI